MTVEPDADSTEPAPPGCTCLRESSDEVGYLEYAVGRANAAAFLDEERAKCAVHGAS